MSREGNEKPEREKCVMEWKRQMVVDDVKGVKKIRANVKKNIGRQ